MGRDIVDVAGIHRRIDTERRVVHIGDGVHSSRR